MKEQVTRLWGWVRKHWVWSSIILIVLLMGMGFGTFWTINLARFGLPPPAGQDCGDLPRAYRYYEDQSVPAGETLQQLGCFWQAYQSCQAATISQTLAGTDAGHTDTLDYRGEEQSLRDLWARRLLGQYRQRLSNLSL